MPIKWSTCSKKSMELWTPLIFRRFNINKRNRGRYRAMFLEQDEFGLGPCLLELSCVRVSLRAQFLLIAFGPLWVLVTHFQAHCQASSQGNPVVSSYTTPGKNAENKLLFLLLSLQKEIPFFPSLLYFWEKETSPKSVQKKLSNTIVFRQWMTVHFWTVAAL